MIGKYGLTKTSGKGTLSETLVKVWLAGSKGKGATLVVPPMAPRGAALAAEGNPGVRFVI